MAGIGNTGQSGALEPKPLGSVVDRDVLEQCDPAQVLEGGERAALLARLSKTGAGRAMLDDFVRQYGALSRLAIQWDSVSYSQMVNSPGAVGRAPASSPRGAGAGACIHLTKRLPEIEHVADLAHELAHATRLSPSVLRGEVDTADEFVRARLTARGGEADAFAVECKVKNELLGRWDELCAPYASQDAAEGFDTHRVVDDLYAGRLSASLTGETYPTLLTRQFKAMLAKRARVQYRTSPYASK